MDPIKDFIEILNLAKAQIPRNLTLFPLLAPESGDPDYPATTMGRNRRGWHSTAPMILKN